MLHQISLRACMPHLGADSKTSAPFWICAPGRFCQAKRALTCEVIATRVRRLLDSPHQLGGNEPCKDGAFFFQVLPLALSELRPGEGRQPRLPERGANSRESRHGTALRFSTAIGDLAAPPCLFTACHCRAQCGAIKKPSLAITESAASALTVAATAGLTSRRRVMT